MMSVLLGLVGALGNMLPVHIIHIIHIIHIMLILHHVAERGIILSICTYSAASFHVVVTTQPPSQSAVTGLVGMT